MDSLLANYASSDEEEEHEHDRSEKVDHRPVQQPASIFSSLTPPKSSSSSSSSLFSFLPPPKSHLPNPPPQTLTVLPSSKPISQSRQQEEIEGEQPLQLPRKEGPELPSSSSSSIFSFLPPPKSQTADPFSLNNISSTPNPKPKKVIQLKLPINPSLMKSRDSDDDEDDKEREGKKSTRESLTQTSSVKSFLSSIPAPRNSSTLGSLPSAAGSGRRSILEADAPSSNSNSNGFSTEAEVGVNPNAGNYDDQWVDGSSSSASLGNADVSVQYGGAATGDGDNSGWVSSGVDYENYDASAGYGSYEYHGQYESNWGDGSGQIVPTDSASMVESMVKMPGKRGRKEVPLEIVEVKQDELMKNRPREDQARLTGIAFGPSYQPASTKGKPTKLHKRKHQIGSLYFDMRQKEMELAERRAKGFLTKAETQAKYGW